MGLEEAICPREALYLVVKVVQVVFHVSTLHHSIFRKNLVSTRGPASGCATAYVAQDPPSETRLSEGDFLCHSFFSSMIFLLG